MLTPGKLATVLGAAQQLLYFISRIQAQLVFRASSSSLLLEISADMPTTRRSYAEDDVRPASQPVVVVTTIVLARFSFVCRLGEQRL